MRALLLLLLLLLAAPCLAQRGPLVVILLPGTSLHDWQAAEAPNLHRLMASGALAVMNTRTARLLGDKTRETPESAALTLGAGSRAAGWSGLLVPAAPDQWPAILRENTGRGYDIHLGNLSDALAAGRISMKAGGGRFAVLVAASGTGIVVPLSSLDRFPEGCTVWDSGSDIEAADAVIGHVAAQIWNRHGRLIVVSPFAGDKDYAAGRRLTPILEWGADVPTGLLASPSTRRPGLVTNTDFAPSVAAYFGRTRSDFPVLPFGFAWSAIPASNPGRQVGAVQQQAYRQARGMQILPYFAVLLAVWILIATALAYGGKRWGVFSWLPLAALLAVLLAGSATEAGAVFAGLTTAGVFVAWWRGETSLLIAFAAIIVGLLTADMATGSHLMCRSLLGYSAVEGARYYGIGNEAMGLLIGSALILASRVWPLGRSHKVMTLIMLTAVACLLGSPAAGAKAGGLLVSLAAFGTFVWESYGGKWSLRVIATFAAATLGVMATVALGDALLFPDHYSHIGEAVQRIARGGISQAWEIVTRKLAVEIRLAWHSAWAYLLWGGLGSYLWLDRMCRSVKHPLKTSGLVAVVACLLLNDAGVVAAALCLVPLWCEAVLQAKTKQPQERDAPRAAMQSG